MNNFKTTTKKEQIIHNGTEETKQKCIPYIIDNRYLKRERSYYSLLSSIYQNISLIPSTFFFIGTLLKI
jgi:hypothetical protein